ncbi:family A1 protease [Polyporus arcularius HHB13444]|uniref:Family A1 protease n=1 Tax=Polyporus arcularius HHB13444 TaxID=1314778 RepID=A0A5C3PPL5_9APHY|nr:family A1 protease [Polyporus arcularius HHB13444]
MLAKLRLLSAVVLALSFPFLINASVVDSNPGRITLPLVKRVNKTGNAKLLEIDQARARALRARAEGKQDAITPASVNATNTAVTYVTTVRFGTPPQDFTLLIDTGSANTWTGARTKYAPNKSPTGHNTGEIVLVTYGSGSFVGMQEYRDTTTLGDLIIGNQSFGDAFSASGFSNVDGILGIGPADLTCGTLILSPACIPTVTDNAFDQGLIDKKIVGIAYAPTTQQSNPNGELTFGYTNSDKYIGPIQFVPITATAPANRYVGINQTTTYGNEGMIILPNAAGIVDTGTTLIMLATEAYNAYKNATNATPDAATGLLKITGDYTQLQSLFFEIGNMKYELTANAQTWPRALNTAISGQPNTTYLIVGDLGTPTGKGLDFILGYTFLERWFHVFDSDNNHAGFAATPFTNATTN